MDIQVGDRVTYKIREIEYLQIIENSSMMREFKNNKEYKILKIERPKYEVLEEKKELLTEEEKEFLKTICKFYDIKGIYFNKTDIVFYNKNNSIICGIDYPENMNFNKVERNKYYTLKELGLEEE